MRPGQVVVKDTSKRWRVWSGPARECEYSLPPRDHFAKIFARTVKPPEMVVVETGAAEARLFSAFLDLAPRFDDESFPHLGRDAGQEAGIQLVSALIGVATFQEPAVHSTVTLRHGGSFRIRAISSEIPRRLMAFLPRQMPEAFMPSSAETAARAGFGLARRG